MSDNSFEDENNINEKSNKSSIKSNPDNYVIKAVALSIIIPIVLLALFAAWFFIPRPTFGMERAYDVVNEEIDKDKWESYYKKILPYTPLCGFPTERCPSISETLMFIGEKKDAYKNYLEIAQRIKDKGHPPIERDNDIDQLSKIFNSMDENAELGDVDPQFLIRESNDPMKDIRETISDDYRFFYRAGKKYLVSFQYYNFSSDERAQVVINVYEAK